MPLAATGWRDARAATAAPPELAQALPDAALHGQARLRFFGLHVYDARLWTARPLAPGGWVQRPFALELEYARSLQGRKIAERSLDEMRRQQPIADADAQRWLATMGELFPDVDAGDRLTGVHLPAEGARFFFNGRPRGELRDPTFARLFFGIWLAPETSEPALRAQLLGTAAR